MHHSKKVLTVFSLVMINVIAVDSLRTLPISAKLGLSLVFYYLIAAVAFVIPVALIAAELATAYPSTGGIYIWVREAFGKRAAFITIWLQWIYNIVWYPTMLAFIAETFAYLISPHLNESKLYLLGTTLSLFWLFTFLNCFGMRMSSLVSVIGASLGTLLPIAGIIILGAIWLIQGNPMPHDFSNHILPDFQSLGNLPLFSVILFGLIGMEMSAVHAEDVRNPQHDYPRALLISTITIITTMTLGSLAIVLVIPNESLSVVSGLIDAYRVLCERMHMPWLTAIIAFLIVMGGLSSVSAWIIGPAKGLLVSARDGSIPTDFARINKHGAPVQIMLAQGVIFTLLCTTFILFDSINAAYLFLSLLSAQMALIVYLYMFAAAIKLRYSEPDRPRGFRIPGGNWVMWLVAGIGIVCCLAAMVIGFIPPAEAQVKNIALFELFLVLGIILFVLLPWYFAKTHDRDNDE